MAVLGELLVCGCRPTDVAVLRKCMERGGINIRLVGSPIEMARLTFGSRPGALILGLGRDRLELLQVIPVVHQMWPELPVVVVAYEDSLDLERRARQAGVFYYTVHPVDAEEFEAVLEGLNRHSERPHP